MFLVFVLLQVYLFLSRRVLVKFGERRSLLNDASAYLLIADDVFWAVGGLGGRNLMVLLMPHGLKNNGTASHRCIDV